MSMRELVGALARDAASMFVPYPFRTIINHIINELTRQEKRLPNINRDLLLKLDQQEEIYKEINYKLNSLILNPIRQGKKLLDEAQYQDGDDFKEYVREAHWKFIEASTYNLPEFPTLPIEATFFTGVCYDLMDNGENALRKYNETFDLIQINSELKLEERSRLTDSLQTAEIPLELRQWLEPAYQREIEIIDRNAYRPMTTPALWNIRKTLEPQKTQLPVPRAFQSSLFDEGINPSFTNPWLINWLLNNTAVLVPKSSLPDYVRQDIAILGKYIAWLISKRDTFDKPVIKNVLGYTLMNQLER